MFILQLNLCVDYGFIEVTCNIEEHCPYFVLDQTIFSPIMF